MHRHSAAERHRRLHLGHALNNTLQDILIRQKRMQGFETLWMPGTDHAGIATQAVVERRLLEEEKLSRHELGRQGLVARIWQWKNEYEARILGQLKEMGCSCDWQRTRFTLDAALRRAVRHTFFKMFRDGLIYRGKRLVNWDTMLRTAVSDDEVFHETVAGHFWYFNYPVIDPRPGEPRFVTLATTRPETMLGDTAVAVHPDPAAALERAAAELAERLAAAPAKEKPELEAELEEVRQRRQTMLPMLAALRDMAARWPQSPPAAGEPRDPAGGRRVGQAGAGHRLRQNHPGPRPQRLRGRAAPGSADGQHPEPRRHAERQGGPYAGQTVLEARENVVADLESGLVVKVEDRQIDLAHSDRSKTPIEPLLTDQWFVRMERPGADGHGRRTSTAACGSSRSATPRAISTGSAKSAIGPSAGSSGGATKSRSGTARRPAKRISAGPSPAARMWSGSATRPHGQWLLCADGRRAVGRRNARP